MVKELSEHDQDKGIMGMDLRDEALRRVTDHVPANALHRLAEVEQLRWKKFELLSSGFICLVDVMGEDESVVQAARVSYKKGTKKVSDSETLIRYLMRHRHSTPFEMAELKFLVRCPMDLWRQWIRHRTANVNEMSTRYSIAINETDETAADKWRLQATSNRQGSEGYLTEWPEEYPQQKAMDAVTDGQVVGGDELGGFWFKSGTFDTPGEYLSRKEKDLQDYARDVYEERIKLGVAREQARKDLPLSTYTEAYWKIDLHNLFHFLGLRMDSHAQEEIRSFATTIGEEIVAPLFPKCWGAFMDYRREATFVSAPAKKVMQALVQAASYEDHPDWVESDAVPPYSNAFYERVLLSVFPDWVKRDEDGNLKSHREREEVRRTLQGLGVLAID